MESAIDKRVEVGEEETREIYHKCTHTPQTKETIENKKEKTQLTSPKSHAQKIEWDEHVVHIICNTNM